MTRPFRFGVVAPLMTDLPTWRDRVRRIAESGYSTLLMPDVPRWQPAPGPTLAVAAAQADLRVGTWVYASPLRPAWSSAWQAHSLSVLTDGLFEMGIGTGRPGIEDELRELGMPVVPPGERLAQVRETVTALRDSGRPRSSHAGGDGRSWAEGPSAGRRGRRHGNLRSAVECDSCRSRGAGTRLPRRAGVELALHVAVIGDTVAPFMASVRDTDPAALREADSLAILPDDPAAAAEEIQRRREEIGYSYFVFGADFADVFAPVVARLAGQ